MREATVTIIIEYMGHRFESTAPGGIHGYVVHAHDGRHVTGVDDDRLRMRKALMGAVQDAAAWLRNHDFTTYIDR
jgi:hypothetical protein